MSLFRDKGGEGKKPGGQKPALGSANAGGLIRKPPNGPSTAVTTDLGGGEEEAGGEEGSEGKRRRGLPTKRFEKHNVGDIVGDAEEELARVEEALKSNPQDEELHKKRYQIVKQHGERDQLLLVLEDAVALCRTTTFFAAKLASLREDDENYDSAVTLREKITQQSPDDADAWRRLALVSVKARDLTRAEAAYTRLLALRPTDETPLGTNFIEEVGGAGLPVAERTALQTMGLRILGKAVTARPDNVSLLEMTARLASRAGALTTSEQYYERLLQIKPDHPNARTWKTELLRVYSRQGKPEKWQELSNTLIADYTAHLEKSPRDGRSWLMLGRQYIQAGSNDLAVHALKQAQMCDSQDWQSVYELGKLLIKMGRAEEAVHFYEDILDPYQSGGPERKSIRRALEKSLADLYFRMGRYKESLDIYSRDEEANTRYIAPLYEAVQPPDNERALELYKKTVKQTPVDAEAYLRLAEFHVRRGNWTDASTVASQGLSCKNAYGDILEGLCVALATAQMKQKQAPAALGTLDQAISNSPDNPSLLFRKVKLLYLSERKKDGAHLAEQVRDVVLRQISCAPAASNLWSLLGDCNSLLGRTDEAEQAFNYALQYDQMDATAWRGLGALYEKKRNLAGALDCYKRFVVLDPIHLSTHPVRQKIGELETQLGGAG